MRFYTKNHKHYCGIDLHARSMYVCIVDNDDNKLAHRKLPTSPDAFLQTIEPYREDLVVAVECLFCWYWIADLCAEQKIEFVLGHAFYMKAIHGGKSKNDRIDSYKIAALLRGKNLPQAYAYPSEMRATRDLLRRRSYFARKRAELLAHFENTRTQHNLEAFERRISNSRERGDLLERFHEGDVQMSMAANLMLLESYDETIKELELHLEGQAREHNSHAFYLLRSIPGVGKILSMTILYEIHEIARFPKVGNFLSYARLVSGTHESAGKRKRGGGKKMGNGHLKWAFSEAAALFLRGNPDGKKLFQRLEKKHGRGKAMSVLSAKLGRAVYFMLKRREPFDAGRFSAA